MTFTAVREGDNIKVQHVSGFATFSVIENPQHLRHFWGQLGSVLDEAEKAAGREAEIAEVVVVELSGDGA